VLNLAELLCFMWCSLRDTTGENSGTVWHIHLRLEEGIWMSQRMNTTMLAISKVGDNVGCGCCLARVTADKSARRFSDLQHEVLGA